MPHRLLGSELITWKYIRTEQIIVLCGVILIIFLTMCIYLASKCIHTHVVSSSADIQIQVYWSPEMPAEEVRLAWDTAAQIPGVDRLATYTAAQALNSMQKTLGPDLDLSWMTVQNPLPPTAVLYATISDSVPASHIIEKVHNLSGVEKVHSNPFQVQAAAVWSQLASTIVWPMITVLLATQAVLLANTVRMSMTKLHGDIHVLRLVGAARWAYHVPILTRMSLLTLLGTGLALAGAKLIQIRVDMILSAPPFHLGCPFVSWPEMLIIFLGAGLVSVLSSALAIYGQDQV